MANSIDVLIATLLVRGVKVLRETCLMPALVNKGYSNETKQKGEVINVPVPKRKSTYSVSPSSTPKDPSDSTQEYATITLDQWQGADFVLTDQERTQIVKEDTFLPQQVDEAIRGLASDVNSNIFSKYVSVYGYTGTAGTTPFSNSTDRTATKDATGLNKVLNDQLCPRGGRIALLDSSAEAEALALPQFANLDKSGDIAVVRDANLGRKFGFNWFFDSEVPTHTAGVPGGTPVVTGANAAAVNDLSDSITVSGMAASGTYLEGDIITIAGDTQTYVVTADATANGSGAATLAIAPGLKVATTGSEAITLKADHVVNLGFNGNAFALVTAPFEKDDIGNAIVQSVRDPYTGLVLRLEVDRQYKQTRWEFDILWGAACVRPELAARLAG